MTSGKTKIYLWESSAGKYQNLKSVSKFSNGEDLIKDYIFKQARSEKRRKYAIYVIMNMSEALKFANRLYRIRLDYEL